MSDRHRYSDETKAGAMAALLAGTSVSEVARTYQIPRGTIARWSSELKRTAKHFDTEKKEAIGDLLLEYVRENLITLRAQAVVFRDPEWIEEQSAQEMAILHGILCDKTVRILEAIGPGSGGS